MPRPNFKCTIQYNIQEIFLHSYRVSCIPTPWPLPSTVVQARYDWDFTINRHITRASVGRGPACHAFMAVMNACPLRPTLLNIECLQGILLSSACAVFPVSGPHQYPLFKIYFYRTSVVCLCVCACLSTALFKGRYCSAVHWGGFETCGCPSSILSQAFHAPPLCKSAGEGWIFDPGDNVFPQPFKARPPEWINFNYICKPMLFAKAVHCCVC